MMTKDEFREDLIQKGFNNNILDDKIVPQIRDIAVRTVECVRDKLEILCALLIDSFEIKILF